MLKSFLTGSSILEWGFYANHHLQMTSIFLVDLFSFSNIHGLVENPFKICLLLFLNEKECSFYTHLFCCTKMRWLFISSTAIWVTDSDTGSVDSRARTKLTSKNVIELELELPRM